MNELSVYRTRAPLGSDQLNDVQRDAVGYFFVRVKATDPQQYDLLMPDEKTEAVIKREYAPHVMNFTREQIDKGMDELHYQRQNHNPDYRFLNFDQIVGLVSDCSRVRPEHKKFVPALPEPPEIKKKRKELGLKHTERLLDLFN